VGVGKRERGGELTSGSKSGNHHLQILGHNGEERDGGEEVSTWENQMRERERKERGTQGRGRARVPGPGQAGLGRIAGQTTPRHAQPQIGIPSAK
jgi:hypothetical protein